MLTLDNSASGGCRPIPYEAKISRETILEWCACIPSFPDCSNSPRMSPSYQSLPPFHRSLSNQIVSFKVRQ